MEAGFQWASPADPADRPGVGEEDAEFIPGVAEYLAQQRAEREEQQRFIIDHDNWDAWCAFIACRTQWRHGFKGITGLDYAGVQSVMMISGIGLDPEIFAGIRYAESGALAAVNKQDISRLLYGD